MFKKLIHIVLALVFFVPQFSSAQNTMDGLGLTAATPSSAAYSLRKLSTSYTGFAIQVRESGSNTLQNIGFDVNGNLDTTALKAFVGSNSAFVSIWYDQSGNGLNAVQANQGSQPRIINVGVIDRRNSDPIVVFSGSQVLGTPSTYSHSAILSTTVVAFASANTGGVFQIGNVNTNGSLMYEGAWKARTLCCTDAQSAASAGQLEQLSATYINGDQKIYRRGVIGASGTMGLNSAANNSISIGNLTSTYNLTGGIAEIILYNSILSTTDRQTVQNNQSTYYSIGIPISSTATGGNWNNTSTWIGGVIPGSSNDVIIATTGGNSVIVNTTGNTIANLTINSTGRLITGVNAINTSGIAINNGIIVTANASGVVASLGINQDRIVLNSTSTVEYNGTVAQNVSPLTYGNLIISNTSAICTLSGTTNVAGNLTINTNAVLDKTSIGLTVSNTIVNNGTFRTSGGRLSTAGGTAYNLAFAPGANILDTLIVNRSASITLNAPLTVNSLLNLSNGLLTVPAGNLTLTSTASITGGTSNSYINGQLIITTASTTSKRLPLGKNGVYSLIDLTPSSSILSVYTLEYFNGTSVTPNTSNLGAGLAGIAANQFWTINRTGANASFTLNYNSSPQGTSSQQVSLVSYNGSQWVSIPNYSSSMANVGNGQVITQNEVTGSYGNFGLGFVNVTENGLDNIGLTSTTPAGAAYSLRKLRSAYTGVAIRIRRGNDNTEINIGFDNNGHLDTTAIKNFVTVNDAFVTTWYDQSGNNRNFLQTTNANQPRIVLAGIIDRKNGQPAIRHIAANANHLSVSTSSYITNNNPWSVSSVIGLDGGANGRVLSGSTNWLLGFEGGGERRAYFQSSLSYNGVGNYNVSTATTNNQIYSAVSNGSSASVFRNGMQLAGTVASGTTSIGTLFTGSYNGSTESSNCTVQEVILFSSALSTSNRAKVEVSQGAYYAVGNFIISTPVGGDWNNPTTWEGGTVPTTNTNVVINTSTGNSVTLNTNTSIASLSVAHLATLDMGSSNTITTVGDIQNNGTIITANTNGLLGSSASINNGGVYSNTIYNTSRVVYNGTVQTVTATVYRNLVIANSGGIKTLGTTNITNVNDTLIINSGVTFNKGTTDLWLRRIAGTGLLASAGGLLRFDYYATANIGTLFMAPAPNNVISTFLLTNSFANAALTLGSPLEVNSGGATLDYGVLNTDAVNTLQLVNSGVSANRWTPASYVNGPVQLTTFSTTLRTVAVGKNGTYNPVQITPQSTATTTFTIEYFNGNGTVTNSASFDPVTLFKVYDNQYWNIVRNSGTSNATYNFYINTALNGAVSSETISITNYDGTKWNAVPVDRSLSATPSLPSNIATPVAISTTGLFAFGSQKAIPTAQSGAWNNPATWVGGAVPSPFQSTYISPGHTVSLSTTASALSVTVATNAILDLTTNQLTGTTGGLVNNGTVITSNSGGLIGTSGSLPACTTTNTVFNAGSRVTYNGGATQTISALTYRKLTISNSASTKTLSGNTTVSDSLLVNSLCTLNKASFLLSANGGVFGSGFIQSTGGSLTLAGTAIQNNISLNGFTNTTLTIATTNSVTNISANTHSNVVLAMQANGNNDSVLLKTPLSVNTLSLQKGYVKTDSLNILTITTSGSLASADSYINGPVLLSTSSTNSILAGIGKQGIFSNVSIQPSSNTPTLWRVEYFPSTPPNNTNIGSGITGLGGNHYWSLSRNTANSASVSFSINQTTTGGTALNALRLALFTADNWTGIPITDYTILGNSSTATLSSATTVTLNATPGLTDYFAIGFGALPGSVFSIASGNWSNPSTWNTNTIPMAGDSVTIKNLHVVALDMNIDAGSGPGTLVVESGAIFNINNGIKYNNSSASYPLDNFITSGTVPSVAMGLRKLVSNYNGPAIQVRRSGNNAVTDIFFNTSGNLNVTELLNFAAGASVFVVKWYDQSGNGRDFVQNSTGNQPRIVNNGLLDTKNNQPAIRHIAASNHFLFGSSLGLVNNFWTVNVVSSNDGATTGRMLSSNSNNWLLGFHPGLERSAHFNGGNFTVYNTATTTANQIYTAVGQNTSNALIYRNSVELSLLSVPSNRPNDLQTAGAVGQWSDGTMQELILFPVAIAGNQRIALENTQQSFYLNGVSYSSSKGVIINGTLGIADANGLNSAILGVAPTFSTVATLDYNGSNQNITPINISGLALTGSGTKTMTGAVSISGILTVNTGVTFNKAAQSLSFSGTTITNNGIMQSTGGNVTLLGSGNISFGFSAPTNVVSNFIVNRAGTHSSTNALIVNGNLTLTNGIIYATGANKLTLTSAATVTGGSNASFIDGEVSLQTNSLALKTVPVGTNNLFAPVTIQPQNNTATNYNIQYFNGVGITPNTGNIGAGISGVSPNQYWSINRNNANNAVVGVTFNSNAGGTAAQQLVLANYVAGSWTGNSVNNTVAGNAVTGTLATQAFISNFGNFTLGYTAAVTENGLDSLGLNASTTSALALSLRKLRSAYQGPAIRVNRLRDSAELDIYFQNNGFLDTVALKTFAAGATGENLLTFSEVFDNTSVYFRNTSSAYSVIPNVTLSPVGTMTADSMNLGRTNGQWDVYRTINNLVVGRTYTLSMYVKLGTATNFDVVVSNTAAWNTVGGKSYNASDGLSTGTWQRINYTFTAPATGKINIHLGSHGGNQTGVTAQTNGSVYIWGIQLEEGATVGAYAATSAAATSFNRVTVKTWYDQSGNNRHAIQTNPSLQPALVINGGVINYMNNKPSMLYDGVDDGFLINNIPTVNNNVNSLFWVQRPTKSTYMNLFPNTANTNGNAVSANRMLLANNGDLSTDVIGNCTNSISSFLINGAPTGWSSSTTRNDAFVALTANPAIVNSLNQPFNFNGNLVIANGFNSTWNFGGDMPEIVVTTSALDSARRVNVELSIGNYYGITNSSAWVSTGTGGNWSDISTWVQNSVPPSGASVAIATTGTNRVTLDTTMTFAAITVRTGAMLDLGASRTTTVTNQLINNGTLITAHANGLTGTAASVVGTITHNSGSTVQYNGTNQTVTAANYRTLKLSGLNSIKTMANAAITVNDTLAIDSTVRFVQSNNSLTLNGWISGKGFIRPSASNTINVGGGNGGNFGTIFFDTTTNNNIVGNFNVNRQGVSPSVSLGNNLQVNIAVNLTSGLLNTSNTALLILNNISTSGGSGGAYINGPVRLINAAVNTARIVHTGKNGLLGAITINPGTTASTSWNAEYFGSNPPDANNTNGSVSSVSLSQYWSVIKNSTASAAPVLSFNFNQSPGGLASASLVLASYSTNWQLVPVNANTLNGASGSGTLTTLNAFNFGSGTVNTNFAIGYPAPWITKQSGNWKNPATWLQASVPPVGSNVIIDTAHVVTMDTTISTSGTPSNITIRTIAELAFNTVNTIGTVSNGITVNGTITTAHASGINTSVTNSTIVYNGGSKLQYNGINQNVPAVNCDKLTLTGGGTKTLTGAVVVNDSLLINNTVLAKAAQNVTLNGTYTATGGATFTSTSGSLILGGSLGGVMGDLNLTGNLASLTVRRYGTNPSINITASFTTTAINMENGILNTDAVNTITLTGTGGSQGSSSAHVNGPILVTTSSNVQVALPIGKNGLIGTVTLIPAAVSATSWSAEYFGTAPLNTVTDATLSAISTAQYWNVRRLSGLSDATISFSFVKNIGGSVNQGLTLSRYNISNAQWTIQSTASNTLNGASNTGIISTQNTINTFGDFAIAFFTNESVSLQTGLWTSASTWQYNQIPQAFGRVTIKPGHIVTLNTNGANLTVVIEPGGRLNSAVSQLTGSATSVTVNGVIATQDVHGLIGGANATDATISSGSITLNSGSEVEYNGLAVQSVSKLPYYKLTLNNAAGLVLDSNITVTDTLRFSNGSFDLNGRSLNINNAYLTSSGSIYGGASSVVKITGSSNFSGTLAIDQSIFGTSNRLDSLIIDRASTTLTLANNVVINNSLVLNNGTLDVSGDSLVFQNDNIPVTRVNGKIATNTSSSIVFGTTGNTSGNAFTLPVDLFTANPVLNNLSVNRDNEIELSNQPLTINGTATLTSGTLAINNTNLTLNGTVTGSGFFKGGATSGLIVGGNTPTGTINFSQQTDGTTNVLNSLTINKGGSSSVDLGNKLVLLNVLTPSAGVLNSNGNLHIRSTASNTARIAQGSTSGGYITGDVTVERYISALNNRAYRLITPSVTTATSINANWQEGKSNTVYTANIPADAAGYGTHITGNGASASGFDATMLNNYSLYTFDQTSLNQDWITVNNTNVNTLNAKTGYLLFVRGNRDNINTIYTTTGSSNTTLRAKGILLQGNQTFSNLESNGRFSLITNPYASTVDWSSIYATNSAAFENTITIWDPNVNTRGGYITIDNNGTTAGGTTNLTAKLQSGQAFFVQSKAGTVSPTFAINEVHKTDGNNLDVFRAGTQTERLNIQLRYVSNGVDRSADGVVALYNNNSSADLDDYDAEQMANWDEDISLVRNNKQLSIESRPLIDDNDTLFLNVQRLKAAQGTYRWELQAVNFVAPRLQAYLQDNYLQTEVPVSLSGNTSISFIVNTDPASTVSNRFRIVFKTATALPVTLVKFTAVKKDKDVVLEWLTNDEVNIDKYIVERSNNGIDFNLIVDKQTAKVGLNNTYESKDINLSSGTYYYRIKIVDKGGQVKYSNTLKISFGNDGQNSCYVYPNPVKSNVINVVFINPVKGDIGCTVSTTNGVIVQRKILKNMSNLNQLNIQFDTQLSSGKYYLELTDASGIRYVTSFIKE